MENIFFLSGLPRTGSTLLTSILSQNPQIHTGANSGLCQVMWDMQVSCSNTEQMQNNPDISNKLLSSIPKTFYENNTKNIVDKCRSWTLPANLELIDNYITKSPKIIVMLRPIVEIVKSFVFIRTMNNWKNPEHGLLDDESEPIMRSLDGVKYAKSINSGQFAFYWYDDLINNPKSTIDNIYKFCKWDQFDHRFSNIQNLSPERDDLLNLIGLHDIRPKLERREIDIKLSDKLYKKALKLDKEMETMWLTTRS
jgi:sulfotransferase